MFLKFSGKGSRFKFPLSSQIVSVRKCQHPGGYRSHFDLIFLHCRLQIWGAGVAAVHFTLCRNRLQTGWVSSVREGKELSPEGESHSQTSSCYCTCFLPPRQHRRSWEWNDQTHAGRHWNKYEHRLIERIWLICSFFPSLDLISPRVSVEDSLSGKFRVLHLLQRKAML